MKISTEMSKLKQNDICSLMLFALYKMQDMPEYSTLSELAYTLDLQSLLKLCEYFGGLTIKIPTLDELELMINALILYQYINIEGLSYEESISKLDCKYYAIRVLKDTYVKLSEILSQYSFLPR